MLLKKMLLSVGGEVLCRNTESGQEYDMYYCDVYELQGGLCNAYLLSPWFRKGFNRSMGTGKMVVELFSVAISRKVCR